MSVATTSSLQARINSFLFFSKRFTFLAHNLVASLLVAIAAGRRLSNRLFGGMADSKLDYSFVPTVVFSHPTIGTVGYTEEDARSHFGSDNIKVYTTKVRSLSFLLLLLFNFC